MNIRHNKSGFTLLEIIVVIIIVGVLASLALPRFFQTIEMSRSTEAMNGLQAMRRAAERCATGITGMDYSGCTDWDALAIDDPSSNLWTFTIGGVAADAVTLTATRTAADGGVTTDTVALAGSALNTAAPVWARSGGGKFSSIK